jgi:hypothetical protein
MDLPEGFQIEGATPQDPRGLTGFIRETAGKYGIDPDTAVQVAGSEGLRNPIGDGGKSHGAFQLYTGGGLGNDFQKATGLDPSDPTNERATIDYALKHASQNGWGAFHGARRIGLSNDAGIGQALALAAPDKAAPTAAEFTKSPEGGGGAPALPEGFEIEKPAKALKVRGPAGGDAGPSGPGSVSTDQYPMQVLKAVGGVLKQAGAGALTTIQPSESGFGGLGDRIMDAPVRGAIWLANKLAPDNDVVKQFSGAKDALDKLSLPPDKDPSNIASVLPAPQGTAERIARTAGAIAPGALAGGQGLIRGAALPAAASEAAGQATAGTEYEPAARMGAAAVTGGALAKGPEAMKGPTSAEYFDASNKGYAQARAMDVAVKTEPMSALATQTMTELKTKGMTPRTAPQTVGALKDLQQTANPKNGALSLSGSDLEAARQELTQIAKNRDTDGAAAGHAIEKLDDYLSNIKQADVHKGDAQTMAMVFDEARQNWAAGKRMQSFEGSDERGKLNTSSAYSGQNTDNATRQSLKMLVRPNIRGEIPARKMGFNDAEIAAIKKTVEGTTGGNTARFFGKMAPTGGLSAPLQVAAAFHTGGLSLPASAGAYGLKLIGDRSTKANLEAARQLAASRGPLARTQALMGPMAPNAPAVRLPRSVQAMLAGLLSVPR